MKHFFEQIFFMPKWYHFPFIFVLMPFSILYGLSMYVRRLVSVKKDFGLPILSVGNLIVGGSGKTPFVIALSLFLASRREEVTVISRGYGRKSTGLVEVSDKGKVLVSVDKSGDEAMLMALSLPKASVIVSEDRELAIVHAKKRGSKVLILDDGFNRVNIEKYEILLEPKNIYNYLPFPAGAFREFYFSKKYANIVAKEERDFKREVSYENLTERMFLVTAISNPKRLEAYMPKGVVGRVTYDDHAYFDEEVLLGLLEKHDANSILCTSKDKVKMQGFKLAISEMKLKLEIQNEIYDNIDIYIEGYASAR